MSRRYARPSGALPQLINDLSGRTGRKVRRVRDDRIRTIGRVLVVVGVLRYLVSALTGLSTLISLGFWIVMDAGGVILMVLNWRRLSGYRRGSAPEDCESLVCVLRCPAASWRIR